MSSIDVDKTLFLLKCVSRYEIHYGVVKNTRIYDFITYFADKIKSCQYQNLCLKSFDSHNDKGYRKDLQSILAFSITNWGTVVQISWCWVTFKYSFLSMKQLRIILHTLLRWELGLEVGIWTSRLGFGLRGWDLGFKAGIWTSRLGYGLRG